MPLLQFLMGIFTGKAGEQLGSTVSAAAQLASVAAIVGPALLWLTKNKDDVFIQLTYGDLAFWGAIIGVQALIVIRLVHRAPAPQ